MFPQNIIDIDNVLGALDGWSRPSSVAELIGETS